MKSIAAILPFFIDSGKIEQIYIYKRYIYKENTWAENLTEP